MTRPFAATTLLASALVLSSSLAAAEWQEAARLERIGAGAAIVFTPDLALPGNRAFYEGLGFLYIETSDWRRVIEQIERHNAGHPESPILSVILETHGTNGHGLKLQASKKARADRSYISVGALAERLAGAGASRAFISACNAGRLFRPRIYRALDRDTRDPLFLPPTLGVIDASPGFDPETSPVRIFRREESHLETLMHASSTELGPRSREALETDDAPLRFVISTMFVQLVGRDPRLRLTSEGWVAGRSRVDIHPDDAEMLFRGFVRWLETVAAAGADRPETEKARLAGPSRVATD